MDAGKSATKTNPGGSGTFGLRFWSMISRICLAVLLLAARTTQAQAARHWTLDASAFGLAKSRCAGDRGTVDFLDDNRLVVAAPLASVCNKDDWDKPRDVRVTVIDLQGHELATSTRRGVVGFMAGPLGHFAICASNRVDFLSGDLNVTTSVAMSTLDHSGFCFPRKMLSPSRTAIAISDTTSLTPWTTRYRLYDGTSREPIAEITTAKGQSVEAIADDGFLICEEKKKQCALSGSHGALRSFPMPVLGGASGFHIAGVVAPDRLLMMGFDGLHLYSETPAGQYLSVGDIARIKPPFIDGGETEMSAAAPRRILYSVDGCLLGDFDDCYGVVLRRFAVFDSETSQMLFRHGYAPGAELNISPNGKIVLEHHGAEIDLYQIP